MNPLADLTRGIRDRSARAERDMDFEDDYDPEASFLAHRARWIAEGDPKWTGSYEPVTRAGVDGRCFGRDDNPGEWQDPDMDVRL